MLSGAHATLGGQVSDLGHVVIFGKIVIIGDAWPFFPFFPCTHTFTQESMTSIVDL